MKSLRGKPAADRGLGSRETERQLKMRKLMSKMTRRGKDERPNENEAEKGSERKRDGEA